MLWPVNFHDSDSDPVQAQRQEKAKMSATMHTWLLDPPAGSNSTFNLCTQFSLIYFYAQVGFCTRTWFLKNWVSFNDTFSADSKENNTLTVVWTGEGNGNPFQYSCLGNSRDRVAWWAAIYGVTQSRTWLKQLSSSSNSSIELLDRIFLEGSWAAFIVNSLLTGRFL